MALPDIKPCPFCGGSASVEEEPGSPSDPKVVTFSVGCDNPAEDACMGYQSLQTFSRRSDAIKAWNRRAALTWTKTTDALPRQDNGDILGERWFLTYHDATGTYDVACIERDLIGRYDFAGFAIGVSHWREITNDCPRPSDDVSQPHVERDPINGGVLS
jgi:hypothetical protein